MTTARVTLVTFFLVTGLFAQQPCTSTVVGDLRVEHFQSGMYGKMMTLRIWLPDGYTDPGNATRKYPTLYFLDGQNAFDDCTAFQGEHELRIDETLTRLIAEKKVPPMIVVGIDSTRDRDYEYEPYKNPINDAKERDPIGRRLPFFFAEEVVPYVSARYRVTDDPAHTGIGGTSLGGFAALYVALNRPDLFRLVLAESPDLLLGNGQLLRDTAFLDRPPDRVAMGVGSTEVNFPEAEKYLAPVGLSRKETEAGVVKMTETLASNLRGAFLKPAKVKLVVDPGANHSAVFWARRIPADLTFLFGEDDSTR